MRPSTSPTVMVPSGPGKQILTLRVFCPLLQIHSIGSEVERKVQVCDLWSLTRILLPGAESWDYTLRTSALIAYVDTLLLTKSKKKCRERDRITEEDW